jgi:hypothetical protein
LDDWVEAVKAVRHTVEVAVKAARPAPALRVEPLVRERMTLLTVPVPPDIVSGPTLPVLNAAFCGTFISEIRSPAKPRR